jgi:predicted SnoaL-like aldol condensation-catalyzing enzyme
MDTEEHKKIAVQFLQLVIAGQIEKAFKQYVDINGKHHNPFTPEGFPDLQKGMTDNEKDFPHKEFTVKHVLGDGDFVAVHSHLKLKPEDLGFTTYHLFRFKDNKIVEMWDSSQQIPADSPNEDGPF